MVFFRDDYLNRYATKTKLLMHNPKKPELELIKRKNNLFLDKGFVHPHFFNEGINALSQHHSLKYFLHQFHTPIEEAVYEIEKRRSDHHLMREVRRYLGDDIPAYFNQKQPILYLSRHVATPNFETLRFIEVTKPYGLPTLIGQDTDDIFVSNNVLKKALGKMSILKATTRNGDEIFENFTLVDFNRVQGKKIRHIKTNRGCYLSTFHNRLLGYVYPAGYQLISESAWISRNHRYNLVAHYKKMLALLITQGIMFEFYEDSEFDFVENILAPTFFEVANHFGCKPLITDLVPDNKRNEKDWNAYPGVIYQFVKRHVEGQS